MIDWVTAVLPCHHRNAINGGRIVKVSAEGEVEWQTEHRFEVKGSHETNIFVKSIDNGRLEITGNPVKFIQGHNLWGTDDLVGLVFELMTRLSALLELSPTAQDISAWTDGNYPLRRVDLTYSYSLDTKSNVRAWLRSAEHSAYLRNRGRGQLTKNSTLYFGKNSRRWALKLYSKGDEIEAHNLPYTLESPSLLDWADDKLRSEIVIRSMELKRRNLDLAANWNKIEPMELYDQFLEGLSMNETFILNSSVLDELSPRQILVYQTWKDGHDLRATLPRNTFYRYRRELLKHGIDIAIRQPNEDRSNVVPLIRVLEAVPAKVPEWAIGTDLYFEPPFSNASRIKKL